MSVTSAKEIVSSETWADGTMASREASVHAEIMNFIDRHPDVDWGGELGETLLANVIGDMQATIAGLGVDRNTLADVVFKRDVAPRHAIGGIACLLREKGFDVPDTRAFLDRAFAKLNLPAAPGETKH